MNEMKKQSVTACSMVLLIAVCRVIPHCANFSPVLCVALFAGHFLDKRIAAAALLIGMMLSDVLLALLYHYPVFGSWSFFTYSGLLAIWYAGISVPSLKNRFTVAWITLLASNIGFWMWTNFGVWAFSGMYSLNCSGVIACYVAALPFLQYSTLGILTAYLIGVAISRGLSAFFGPVVRAVGQRVRQA